MRGASAVRQGTASRRQDPWDEDDTLEDDESGPSWTKVYVGGMKVRQYAFTAVEDLLRDWQQPDAA